MTKRGSTGTTQRRKSNRRFEKRHLHPTKEDSIVSKQSKSDALCFFTVKVLSILNVPPTARLSIRNTTWKFYVVFEMQFVGNDLPSGLQEIGTSTMTTPHHHTHRILCKVFLRSMEYRRCDTLRTLLIWPRMTFFCSQD